MHQLNWANIEGSYGDNVVRYLQNCNVTPEATAPGVYKIPSVDILKECSKLAETTSQRLTEKKEKQKKSNLPSPKNNTPQEYYDLSENFKRIVNIDANTPKPSKFKVQCKRKTPLVDVNLKICLEEQYKLENNIPGLSFSKSILRMSDKADKCENIFKSMMQTKIGHNNDTDYENCLKEVEPVMRKFQREHKKFKYFSLLENILEEKGSSEKNDPHVSLQQLQKYFYCIFATIIPGSLFGSNRNVKKLRAGLRQCFLASWGETICLKSYLFGMDISRITWLKPIKEEISRWLIIAKVVKWLFEVFLVAILKIVFSVQKDLYSAKKIFLSSVRWKRSKNNYMEMQQRRGCIAKACQNPYHPKDNGVPTALIALFPKRQGVRPIYRIQYDENVENEVAMLNILLQQLYLQKYHCVKTKNLYFTWLMYTKRNKENSNRKVHLVSSDVANAYGSIIQTKLYNIIQGMINEISDQMLTLEWLAILEPSRAWKRNSITYKRWFSCCTTFPPMTARSMVTLGTDPEHPKEFISKEFVCTLLRRYILQQTFWFNGDEYILKKGIAQGSRLSPILSEIYYAHMTTHEFANFMRTGTLARFADDYLYITEDEESAKQYIKKIRRGVPGYRCHFNVSKTQTNVKSEFFEISMSVMYLGYRIDSTSLDVTPVYGKLSFRHFNSMQRINLKNEISTFVFRMRNFTALKLSPIVLDTRINSPETILSTAKLAGYAMASRCVTLISKLFDEFESNAPEIWDEIRHSVKILALMFARYLFGYKGERRDAFIRGIKISIWQSFYRVFARRNRLHLYFCNDIKRMINNRVVF